MVSRLGQQHKFTLGIVELVCVTNCAMGIFFSTGQRHYEIICRHFECRKCIRDASWQQFLHLYISKCTPKFSECDNGWKCSLCRNSNQASHFGYNGGTQFNFAGMVWRHHGVVFAGCIDNSLAQLCSDRYFHYGWHSCCLGWSQRGRRSCFLWSFRNVPK